MKRWFLAPAPRVFLFQSLLLCLDPPISLTGAQPTAQAVSGFYSYNSSVELRLERQHRSPDGFLAPADPASGDTGVRLRHGELIIERLTPSPGPHLSGALLHHWRGTAFVPGAGVGEFEGLLRDFDSYPRYFSPEVLKAGILPGGAAEKDGNGGNHMQVTMRVRQKHVITVVLDTAYDVTFGRLDARHGYSISRSTRISEIESPGTKTERTLSAREEHGFLWRMNTFWSYEERDGGLYLQIETISLTRSIPRGLGWAIRPWVESIPRESLEFTLRAARQALAPAPEGVAR